MLVFIKLEITLHVLEKVLSLRKQHSHDHIEVDFGGLLEDILEHKQITPCEQLFSAVNYNLL